MSSLVAGHMEAQRLPHRLARAKLGDFLWPPGSHPRAHILSAAGFPRPIGITCLNREWVWGETLPSGVSGHSETLGIRGKTDVSMGPEFQHLVKNEPAPAPAAQGPSRKAACAAGLLTDACTMAVREDFQGSEKNLHPRLVGVSHQWSWKKCCTRRRFSLRRPGYPSLAFYSTNKGSGNYPLPCPTSHSQTHPPETFPVPWKTVRLSSLSPPR